MWLMVAGSNPQMDVGLMKIPEALAKNVGPILVSAIYHQVHRL
jgi:hypothetical protein